MLFTPEGHTLLIDAGTERAGERHVLPYLERCGKRHIDAAIITHEHWDHAGGFAALAGKVQTDTVMIPRGMDQAWIDGILVGSEYQYSDAPSFAQLVRGGNQINAGSVRLEMINPIVYGGGPEAVGDGLRGTSLEGDVGFSGNLTFDPNEASLVFRVVCGEFSMLLCADAGRKFEQEVFRCLGGPEGHGVLRADVLKVGGHHGSSSATSARFLEAVKPSIAVISVGRNSYGHPSQDTVERLLQSGAAVLRTDEVGAVRVEWHPKSHRLAVSDMRLCGKLRQCSESLRRWINRLKSAGVETSSSKLGVQGQTREGGRSPPIAEAVRGVGIEEVCDYCADGCDYPCYYAVGPSMAAGKTTITFWHAMGGHS